jgi:hypothetical protein
MILPAGKEKHKPELIWALFGSRILSSKKRQDRCADAGRQL